MLSYCCKGVTSYICVLINCENVSYYCFCLEIVISQYNDTIISEKYEIVNGICRIADSDHIQVGTSQLSHKVCTNVYKFNRRTLQRFKVQLKFN